VGVSSVHAKDLLVLLILHILIEKLVALNGHARLELFRGDLFTVYDSNGLILLQNIKIQIAVNEHQDDSCYHADRDILNEPGLPPFAFKAGDMLLALDFGFRRHKLHP
jgi:hypothetical protein